MVLKFMNIAALLLLLVACQRGARNVNLEGACDTKDKNGASSCAKPSKNDKKNNNSETGNNGKFDKNNLKQELQDACVYAKHKDDGLKCTCSTKSSSVSYSKYLNSVSGLSDFRTDLSNQCKKDSTTAPDTQKPPSGGPTIPQNQGPSTPQNQGPSTKPPSAPPANQDSSSGSGNDQTSNAGLGVFVSKQGVLTLLFSKDNVSKFSAMEYSTEKVALTTPSYGLAMQGQSNTLGIMELRVALTFKFDGKSCTGSATAKFDEQTNITVKCQ